MKIIICGTALHDRYKKKLACRMRHRIIAEGLLSEPCEDKIVLIGDWTLYRGDEMPNLILSRDAVKRVLGVKKLKVW